MPSEQRLKILDQQVKHYLMSYYEHMSGEVGSYPAAPVESSRSNSEEIE
jgi:hypothetical protein